MEETNKTATTMTMTPAAPATKDIVTQVMQDLNQRGLLRKPRVKGEKRERASLPHTAKIDKVAKSLASLSSSALEVYNAAAKLSNGDLCLLTMHLSVLFRRRSVESASQAEVKVGDRIVVNSSADARLIGRTGVLTKVNKVRCYAKLDGDTSEKYFYVGDLAHQEDSEDSQKEDADDASEPTEPSECSECSSPIEDIVSTAEEEVLEEAV